MSLKKLIIALAIVVPLAGCYDVTLEMNQLGKAEELCEGNGGLRYVGINGSGGGNSDARTFYPTCNNGAEFSYRHDIGQGFDQTYGDITE